MIKVPVAGRHDVPGQARFLPVFFQPGVGPDIDAGSLLGIYFAPSLKASAAGAVALVFRALRHGTQVGRVGKGAIAAVAAVKEGNFGEVFQFVEEGLDPRALHGFAKSSHRAVEVFSGFIHQPVEKAGKTIGAFNFCLQRPGAPVDGGVPVESGCRICFKEVKPVVDGVMKIPDQFGPARHKHFPLPGNLFHMFVADVVAADVNAAVSHSFQNGVHPGGAKDSRAFPFVRVASLPVDVREQLVRDDRARQVVAVHHFRRAEGKDVNVAHQGDLRIVLLHEEERFMEFPCVVSQLRNDELRAGGDFLFQLVVLPHLLGFSRLEGGNNRAGEKISRLMRDGAFDSGIGKPPVHARDQLQEVNGIQIEDRRGPPLEAGHRVVAAHDEEIPDARAVQGVKLAFTLVAVFVLAGKMDKGFDAQFENLGPHEVGGHGRGSARIVRERKRANFMPAGGLLRLRQAFLLRRFFRASARHQFPGDREFGGIEQGLFEPVFRHAFP